MWEADCKLVYSCETSITATHLIEKHGLRESWEKNGIILTVFTLSVTENKDIGCKQLLFTEAEDEETNGDNTIDNLYLLKSSRDGKVCQINYGRRK